MKSNKIVTNIIKLCLNEQQYYDENNGEYYDLMKINLSEFSLSKKSLLSAFNNFINGNKSQSKDKPLEVWKNENGLFFLTDGYHRVFEYLLHNKLEQDVIVVGEGYSDYWSEPKGDNLFVVEPNMEFNGLENIISIKLLKSLK